MACNVLFVSNVMSTEIAHLPRLPAAWTGPEVAVAVGAGAGTIAAVFWMGTYAWVAAIGLSIAWQRRIRRETEAYEREATDARAAGQRGQLSEAQAVFWAWAEKARTPAVAALARIDLGQTLVERGDHTRAIAVLEATLQNYRDSIERHAKTSQTAVWLALAYALHGEGEVARTWLDPAKRGKGSDELAVFVDAIVRSRAGETGEAATLLAERWIALEAGLTGRQLRAVRVVRAFAEAAAGPRANGPAASVLLGIRPAYPGELAFLGTDWPDMAAFLAAHGLS